MLNVKKRFLGEGFTWHGRGGMSALSMFGDWKSYGAFRALGRVQCRGRGHGSRDGHVPVKLEM